jgi:hypothetical protein
MTTLLDEHGMLVVRCDECRRLWPVTRQRLETVWERDEFADRHRCPVCIHPWPRDLGAEDPLPEPIG